MIRSALRTLVVANVGRTDKTTEIDAFLDLAVEELGKIHDFRSMWSTTDIVLSHVDLTFDDGSWDLVTMTLTKAAAFADYTRIEGDMIYIVSGTGMTAGWYEVSSNTDNTVVLATSPGANAADVEANEIQTLHFVALPSNTWHLIEARHIDGTSSYKLDIRSQLWITRRFPNVIADNRYKPIYGYTTSSRLYVSPPYNASYTMRLTTSALPIAYTADSTENPLIATDAAQVAIATAYLKRSLGMHGDADQWDRVSGRLVAAAIRSDQRETGKNLIASGTTDTELTPSEYWNDPFVKYNP